MSLLPYDNFGREFFNAPSFDLDFPRMPPNFFDLSLPHRDNWFDSFFRRFNGLSLQDAGYNITSDRNKFQVSVDVQHFAPEDIVVKVKDNTITVEARHEDKRDSHGYVARQFVRKYTLPEGCLPSLVESQLSSDGVLTVTCPKKLALPYGGEKIIPVRRMGPISRRFY